MVSLALQLPESEATGVSNGRLTDKFPSSTTLWQVLRKFEDGVAGTAGQKKNLTARGVPSTGSGSGRLFYSQPVLQVMNRELSTFSDLQKTLAQLGLNSGSALMRLSYRQSELPLEDAMVQIQAYFDSLDPAPTPKPSAQIQRNQAESVQPATLEARDQSAEHPSEHAPVPEYTEDISSEGATEPAPDQELNDTSVTSRPVSVYRPPTATSPSASLLPHNEADYTPTVEHAQVHQKMLNQSSRNQRLPTEAEIAKQQEEESEKLAAIKDVEIKIRFPDQSSVSSKFGQQDTGSTLYTFVRECLDSKYQNEAFFLRNPGVKGKNEVVLDKDKKLIKDLLLKGRVLVVFAWDDTKASIDARSARSVLKPELQARAQELKPAEVPGMADDDNDRGVKVNISKNNEKVEEGSGSGIGKKMPKWLKGLGKK